jgi:cell wall-associated NlpC family hydrolase
METMGWVLILVAALIVRGVARGRSLTDNYHDLADLFTHVLSNDLPGAKAVLARTGDSNIPAVVPAAASAPGSTQTPSSTSSVSARAAAWAQTQVGKPYRWGATGPDAYDCSGLVYAAFKQFGVTLPRTSQLMMLSGVSVDQSNLQVGDLVFPDPNHVQIYVGGGKIVEAPHSGAAVRVVPMWGFQTARRVEATPVIGGGRSLKGGTQA